MIADEEVFVKEYRGLKLKMYISGREIGALCILSFAVLEKCRTTAYFIRLFRAESGL